jgi:DNA-binding response OmpR family regulator
MPIQEDFFPDDGAQSRILIVDDEPQVVRAITQALTRDSPQFRVVSTNDGFEAGLLVASFQPHLVILDLMMTGVDGFQLCQAVRGNPNTARIRILVITGFAEPENMARLRALGVDDVMEKPLDLDEFLACAERLLSAGPRRDRSRQVGQTMPA